MEFELLARVAAKKLLMSTNSLVSEAAFQILEKEKMKSRIQTGFVAALDSFI